MVHFAEQGGGWSGVAVVADLAKLSVDREDYYVREIADESRRAPFRPR
jgi:hypothetical protein